MAKKKKVWKSVALEVSNLRDVNKIRAVLASVAKGDCIEEDPEALYEILAAQFDKIERLESDAEILETLAWFLNCEAYFDFPDPESDGELFDAVESLFADAVALFAEKAEEHENREFVLDLMHDLLVNSVGEGARTEVFLGAQDFLSAEETERVAENVLSTVSAHELENEEEILTGLLDLADGTNDPALYEKIAFLKDPDRSNKTLVDVANAYYIAGNIPQAKRLMDEVKNPTESDEEEFLDLKIALLFNEGKTKEALEAAEALYEKFPKEYHLLSLCQVVSPERKNALLDAHEAYRLSVHVSPDYVNLLTTLNEWERLSDYLDRYKKEIPLMDAEGREVLAARLEEMKQGALAKKLRRI